MTSSSATTMRWRFGTASDIGDRAEQQDRVAIVQSSDGDDYLIAVADGMGGYQGGALAAQAVIDTVMRSFEKAPVTDPLAFLETLCHEAHQAVMEFTECDDHSPGSTCVLLYLYGDEAYWAHVGDSRLYHFRNGKALTRTLDHSMVQLLVSEGKMSEEEMATSPLQNQLYMRLGGSRPPNPELGAAQVQKGDLFILCSDGFWESVDPEEVSTFLTEDDLEAAVKRLVKLASARGGEGGDNVALAIAQLDRPRRRFRLFS